MGRMSEMLVYGVMATVLVCGALYALAWYADNAAPDAPSQALHAASHPAVPASVPRAPAPAGSTVLPPALAENVVRTSTKTYYLTSANPALADADTYNSLRRTCYDAARNNSEGEFPTMQQSACDRFAAFARQKGWDTGRLPAYGTPRPWPRGPQVAVIGASQPVDSAECDWLYQAEQGVEAELRAGYQEPRGNWLRARQRELQEELWRLHCPQR